MSLDNPLIGIVLAGGESSRMGEDKGKLIYHKDAQSIHMLTLLNQHCTKTFLSVKRYKNDFRYPQIKDSYNLPGPINGILSALINFPGSSVLTVTVDMPGLDNKIIELLINSHSFSSIATCFTLNNHPEPFPSIWNVKSFEPLLRQAENGNCSPMFFLKNNNANLINTDKTERFININSPLERKHYLSTYTFEN